MQELPPRARRIPIAAPIDTSRAGTTSACAENTAFRTFAQALVGNYLRVRGEYRNSARIMGLFRELPPRARRIPLPQQRWATSQGTTSACAENTSASLSGAPPTWNYLRVRGEYGLRRVIAGCMMELPPRARRIP